jgi:hypothetical protein
MSKKNMILRNKQGELRIESLQLQARHSEMLQVAPPGFGPGDEKYIEQGKDGKLIFHYDRKFKAAKKENEPVKKRIRAEKWNQASVLERIKGSLKA